MDPIAQVSRWLTGEGRFVGGNRELLEKLCALIVEVGVPLARSWFHIRALRPGYAGVSRIWRRGQKIEERFLDHGFEKTAAYLNSPVRFVVEHRDIREWRLDSGKALPFPVLEELRAAGYVHYVIAPIIFSDGTANAISWATDHSGGFSAADLQFFAEILPGLSLLVEVKSLRRFATSVLATYVGREPGELILKGQVRRGSVRTIRAALMLADLRDFSAMSDALPPAAVIETLNQYFDCVIPPITRRGGEVMEIMGDGVLAIFNDGADGPREACRRAFEAATEGLQALARSNQAAGGQDKLVAGFALHHGTVAYGNIGSGERLDFTVIGRDVNLTSRIEKLCRELGRQMIMSETFVGLLQEPMFEIGHFALRGVPKMQLLYGLPPEFPIDDAAAVASPTDEG